jgi:hypothetical protein
MIGIWLILEQLGALTICPPTNRPRDILTQTKRPPNKPSVVTIYYCDIRPPIRSIHVFFVHPAFKVDGLSLVTLRPPSPKCSVTSCPPFPEAKFGRFVTTFWDPFVPAVWQHVDVLSQDFSQHVCNVQPAFQRSVDVSSPYFWTSVMSCPPAQQTVDVLSQDL